MSIKITSRVVGETTTQLTVEWKCMSFPEDLLPEDFVVPTSANFCLHLHDNKDDELLYYVGEWSRFVTYSYGMTVLNPADNRCYKAINNTLEGAEPHESSDWEIVSLAPDKLFLSTASLRNPIYIPENTVYSNIFDEGWLGSEGSRVVELENEIYGNKFVTVTECYINSSQIYNTKEEASAEEWRWIDNTSIGYVVGVLHGYSTVYETLASPVTTNVKKWDWYSTNVNATAGETEDAYNALLTLDAVELFNFAVWNDLVDKVNEIIEALGGEWSTMSTVDGSTYLSFEETKMSEDDSELTYHRFNSWRFNIGSRFSTEGIMDKPIKEEGDVVSAGDFLALVDHINNWIDAQL